MSRISFNRPAPAMAGGHVGVSAICMRALPKALVNEYEHSVRRKGVFARVLDWMRG